MKKMDFRLSNLLTDPITDVTFGLSSREIASLLMDVDYHDAAEIVATLIQNDERVLDELISFGIAGKPQ